MQLLPGPGRGMPAGRGMGMMPPGACTFVEPATAIQKTDHMFLRGLALAGRPMPYGPPGMPGPPPGFRPPGMPPGMPFPPPPPGFGSVQTILT